MPEIFANPFQATAPVEPREVIDRENELAQLVSLAIEGNNARLVAPRRYGKTSLLRKVQEQLDDSGDWITIYVDLLGIVTPGDFADRVEIAYAGALKNPFANWFAAKRRSLRPQATLGGGPAPGALSVDLTGSNPVLLNMLDLPLAVAKRTEKRVHVVFDEFQELLKIGSGIDGVVRSCIQHHGQHASYVFAGSQIHMMEEMFNDRRRAFYGQAKRVALTQLSAEHLGDYVVERFERTGRDLTPEALGALLDAVQGHPQRAMLAAHELWNAAGTGPADLEAWDRAFVASLDEVAEEARAEWSDLTAAERRTLLNLAIGTAPYAAGQSSRGKAVKDALDSLEDKGLIAGQGRQRFVVDPFLRTWVAMQRQ